MQSHSTETLWSHVYYINTSDITRVTIFNEKKKHTSIKPYPMQIAHSVACEHLNSSRFLVESFHPRTALRKGFFDRSRRSGVEQCMLEHWSL